MKIKIIFEGMIFDSFNGIKLIQGIKGIEIGFQLLDESNNIVDISSFIDIKLELKNILDGNALSFSLTPTEPTEGKFKWIIGEEDLSNEGIYSTEITFTSNEKIIKIHSGLLTVVKEIK